MAQLRTVADLGKLVVRSIIGDVFGNNMVRVTLDLFNYNACVTSINFEKADFKATRAGKPAPVAPAGLIPFTRIHEGDTLIRVFKLHGHEVLESVNPISYTAEFYMNADLAKQLHEPWTKTVENKVAEGTYGMNSRTVQESAQF